MENLFTWIGDQDLVAAGIRSGSQKIESGPILSAVKAESFDSVYLISDYAEEAPLYKEWLSKQFSGEIHLEVVSLNNNPTDISAIYESTTKLVERVFNKQSLTSNNTFHLSPGTWSMAVVWVIISQAKFPARLIQSSKEAGVQTVDVPFEVSAEYLLRRTQIPDNNLKRANTLQKPLNFGKILFRSEIMNRLAKKAAKASQRDIPILLEGEVGTEKEEFARAIHFEGPRKEGPFIKVSCRSLDEEELETFIFGKEDPFTKGTGMKLGEEDVFTKAKGGTLYFDDIGSLPPKIQAKLHSKLINDFEEVPQQSHSILSSTCRIIASSSNKLVNAVADGEFHEDLFFMISVLALKIPALRERRDDISPLIDQILNDINDQSSTEPGYAQKSISPAAKNILTQRDWPANKRELENSLRQAAVWSDRDTISEADIWDAISETPPSAGPLHHIVDINIEDGVNLKSKLEEVADHLIEKAVTYTEGNRSNAAKLLGFDSYQAFAYWNKRLEQKKQKKQ